MDPHVVVKSWLPPTVVPLTVVLVPALESAIAPAQRSLLGPQPSSFGDRTLFVGHDDLYTWFDDRLLDDLPIAFSQLGIQPGDLHGRGA